MVRFSADIPRAWSTTFQNLDEMSGYSTRAADSGSTHRWNETRNPGINETRKLYEVKKMRHIDIDSLSEAELIELNHKVVARLRFLNQARSHSAMLDFRIGERVRFRPSDRDEIVGTLTRYNKKSVTIITDSGEHWNVAPTLLKKAESAVARETSAADESTLIPFSNRATRK